MKIIKIFLIVLLVFGVLCIVLLKTFLLGPSVKRNTKKEVTNFAKEYLIAKYGNHNFKITKVEYDFHMTKLFDYTNPIGYMVYFKSDVSNFSYVSIEGLESEELKVKNDSLIEDYYFPNLVGYERYDAIKALAPVEKIQDSLSLNLKENFESTCINVICNNTRLNIPNNTGKIPTIDELKNNIDYYEILDFNFKLSNYIEDQEKYKNKLNEYLNQTLGGTWNIYFNPNGSITCIKDV